MILSDARRKNKSIRLPGYDYSQAETYFVTICTFYRKSFLGSIIDNQMTLSSIGKIAHEFWVEIPNHFNHTNLDVFIIMPNHLHGLIQISETDNIVAAEHVQPRHTFQHVIKGSVGSIIRQYKGSVTRWCNQNGYNKFGWQRNFYEHIVRNEKELNRIREYIISNPMRWNFDRDNKLADNFNMDLDEYYKTVYKN